MKVPGITAKQANKIWQAAYSSLSGLDSSHYAFAESARILYEMGWRDAREVLGPVTDDERRQLRHEDGFVPSAANACFAIRLCEVLAPEPTPDPAIDALRKFALGKMCVYGSIESTDDFFLQAVAAIDKARADAQKAGK